MVSLFSPILSSLWYIKYTTNSENVRTNKTPLFSQKSQVLSVHYFCRFTEIYTTLKIKDIRVILKLNTY